MTDESRRKFIVSTSPHIRSDESISEIMWTVFITLIPASLAGIYVFGYYAAEVMVLSVIVAVLTEFLIQHIRGVPKTVHDGSAAVTGLLVALVLPPNVPLYVAGVASFISIALAKQAFGGLGCNIWNPALVGRAFAGAAWAGIISITSWPFLKAPSVAGNIMEKADAVSGPTPLYMLKTEGIEAVSNKFDFARMFVGNKMPGSMGEISAMAILFGGLWLWYRGYINIRVPMAYIGTVAVLVWILPQKEVAGAINNPAWFDGSDVMIHIFSGGLMLGAFYMATDMVTSPMTNGGLWVFGIGCGILTAVIRLYSGMPEGVCYSILLMNTAVPLIDRLTWPRLFGAKK